MPRTSRKSAASVEKSATGNGNRVNQLRRTRQDLLEAAKRLMRRGAYPTLEEVASEALVSRATAYRHFPNVDALMAEASLDLATPQPDEVLAEPLPLDAVVRLEKVDDAFWEMIVHNEHALRIMLSQTVRQRDEKTPARQNRRTPLIEAALGPLRDQFDPEQLVQLMRALALVIGTESMIVCKDVLQLSDADARQVRRWAIRALVDAAKQ